MVGMNGSETPAPQAVKAAVRAYEDALAAHWEAEGMYELAILRGDPDERDRAREALHVATTKLATARSAVVAARAASAPSFEDLLRNPYLQFDREGVVLSSIRRYHQVATAAGRSGADALTPAEAPGLTGVPGLTVNVIGAEPFSGHEMWVSEEATTPGRQLVH